MSLENFMLSERSQTQKTTHSRDSTQAMVGIRESAEAEKRAVNWQGMGLGKGTMKHHRSHVASD